MKEFVHLHVHSHYSLLESLVRLRNDGGNEGLISAVRNLGMKSIALTDRGNLFGSMEFYAEAKSGGIKPILGMEANVRSNGVGQTRPLILLAMNTDGWRNLMKLSTLGFANECNGEPYVTTETIAQYSSGLIGIGGDIETGLLNGDVVRAQTIYRQYCDIFGPDRFFIEVQNYGLPEQAKANQQLISIARGMGAGVVAGNDVRFLRQEDKPCHDVLTAILAGAKTGQTTGRYSSQQYLKSADEMSQAFKDLPNEALENTWKIAEMCNVELDCNANLAPTFHLPQGVAADDYLRKLAHAGLVRRVGPTPSQAYRDRLEMELKAIADRHGSLYFLILNDLTEFARDKGIPCHARGGAVASLVGYSLGISCCDPIAHGLLFERFIADQSKGNIEIDLDVCGKGCREILQYLRLKYGQIARTISFGIFGAKMAIKDVGAVMNIASSKVDAIVGMVPKGANITIADAIESQPELRSMAEGDASIRELFDAAMAIEGLKYRRGVHVASVIVSSQPFELLVPLCRQCDVDDDVTQWEGRTCQLIGMVRINLVELEELTVLRTIGDMAKADDRPNPALHNPPLDDDKVFELFRTGNTNDVFQFESEEMKNILSRICPTRMEDLIAANAMCRPGLMELIPAYCERKNGREKVPSLHPLVDELLAETYGIMCYQEQAMLVLNRVAGLPLCNALDMVKAIGSSDELAIESARGEFLAGAKSREIPLDNARKIFDLLLASCGKMFHKAIVAANSNLAYRMAYLKIYRPKEFAMATITTR